MENTILTKEELNVMVKALEEFNKRKDRTKRNEEIMKGKKFNYGDIVIKKRASSLDGVFNIRPDDIGIIVGHYDCDGLDGDAFGRKRDMFRVHYSDWNNYTGEEVEWLELYDGETPEHLKNIAWNTIDSLSFDL